MTNAPKKERIDHILLRQGIVTEEQIEQALMRQKSHGGRLGTHLLYLKAVTEEQLVRALAEQLGTPGVILGDQRIPDQVTQRLTLDLAEEFDLLPFRYEAEGRTLCVAMIDPLDKKALQRLQSAVRGVHIKPYVGCETVVLHQIARHYRRREGRVLDRIIELPALLVDEPAPDAAFREHELETPAVLMVSRAAFHKNILVPVFRREGVRLDVSADVEEIELWMRERHVEHILIAEEMEQTFVDWARAGRLPPVHGEIVVFNTVSGAILDNPAPYGTMIDALLRSLEQLAARRCRTSVWKPPYRRICDEIERMSRLLGLRRLAVGGMQVAALLLVPSELRVRQTGEYVPEALSFSDLEASIEIARSLRFPWNVEVCLRLFADMISQVASEPSVPDNPKLALAAQLLALVWYRHSAFRGVDIPVRRLGDELQRQAAHLTSKNVVETYARLLASEARRRGRAPRDQVLVVGWSEAMLQRFAAHLETEGYRVVPARDVSEALRLYERRHPDAVVVASDDLYEEALVLCRTVRETSEALVYALTHKGDVAPVRELLDAGFNDVFVPPFDHTIMASRLGRALDIRRQYEQEGQPHSYSGTLAELPFVDLMQTLGANRRTVRIDLRHPSAEQGVLFLREGQMVHAVCGNLKGPEAVYRFIAWGDAGTFATEAVEELPEDNIDVPNHALLLEGRRLLDESAVEAT